MGAHPQSNDWVVVPELPDLFQWMERKILTMEKLRAKLKENSGFTLVEMLIVVAIIAILIAVSIPMVSSSLEKAREAVDDANHRDAIGLGNIMFLTGEADFSASDADQTFYYCVDENRQGKLVSTTETDAKNQAEKAQCTCPSRTTGSKSAKDNIITVTIAKDGTVSAAWGAAT